MPNHFTLTFFLLRRRDVSCSHSNRDLFTCEDNMLFSHVKISCFRAKAHLVFHWYLYYKLIFRYSAQILLENALFCRQNAHPQNRLFCSKFCRQNLSKPNGLVFLFVCFFGGEGGGEGHKIAIWRWDICIYMVRCFPTHSPDLQDN